MGSYRNVQRLQTRAARPASVEDAPPAKKKSRAASRAAAEQNRLRKERAAAEAWRKQEERRRRARQRAEQRERRAAEERDERERADRVRREREAIEAELYPDDRRFRPQQPDSVLVGKNRVTGLTAAAVTKRQTLTKFQWKMRQPK